MVLFLYAYIFVCVCVCVCVVTATQTAIWLCDPGRGYMLESVVIEFLCVLLIYRVSRKT